MVQHSCSDSISDIKIKQIGEAQAYMAISSWDGTIQVFQVEASQINSTKPEVKPLACVKTDGAVLGICWIEDLPGTRSNLAIFVAHSNGNVYRWDPENGK
jgi:hypothetical protein